MNNIDIFMWKWTLIVWSNITFSTFSMSRLYFSVLVHKMSSSYEYAKFGTIAYVNGKCYKDVKQRLKAEWWQLQYMVAKGPIYSHKTRCLGCSN